MPSVDESVGAKSELASDLAAGTNAISSDQVVTFRKYIRLVLPIDGYVFWVRADLVSQGAILNAMGLNTKTPNAPTTAKGADVITPSGSLHYATEQKQAADSTYAVNRIVFTSLSPVNDFNTVGPNVMFIGEFQGKKFAFSSRKSFYRQADLYHYAGDAVYAIMESQLVDSLAGFSSKQIVSNSLPIWLSMNGYLAEPWQDFGNPEIVLYPAFLAEENASPPFGAVDIPPETSAIALTPRLSSNLSHSQLVREKVKITLWGIDNDAAMTFVDFVNQYSNDFDLFGIMNMPAIRDERVTQVELGTIAKKKTIEYEINYYQTSARAVARQLIESAIPSFYIGNQLVA